MTQAHTIDPNFKPGRWQRFRIRLSWAVRDTAYWLERHRVPRRFWWPVFLLGCVIHK